MNRVTKAKLMYTLVYGSGGLLLLWATLRIGYSYKILYLYGVCSILFIYGRIQRYYCKDFTKGKKLSKKHNYHKSIEHYNDFLKQLKDKPWVKKLMWISRGIYTKDIDAMTYNNIGGAYTNLFEYDLAQEHLLKAIDIDEGYLLPYVNLSILSILKDDREMAESYFRKAEQLGYKKMTFDNLFKRIKSLQAKMENNH